MRRSANATKEQEQTLATKYKHVRRQKPEQAPPRPAYDISSDIENSLVNEDGSIITITQREERLFIAAKRYSVALKVGPGRNVIKYYATYPEAMLVALHVPAPICTRSPKAIATS
jgi:hypothetical protein